METVTSKQKEYLEQPKERISGSEAIVRCLLAEGVEVFIWLSWWGYYARV